MAGPVNKKTYGFSDKYKKLMVGVSLVSLMTGMGTGLFSPPKAEAITDTEAIILGLGAAAAGYVFGPKILGGGGGGYNNMGGPARDDCGFTETNSYSSGYSFQRSGSRTTTCPPRPQQQASVVYQQVAPPQVQQPSAELQQMRAELDSLRVQKRLDEEKNFYKDAAEFRAAQAQGFCMNVTRGSFLDSSNRAHCADVLNQSNQGKRFLADIGRSDLIKGEFAAAASATPASVGGDQCTTETIKETVDANGKVTGREINKVTRPCSSLKN